MFFNEAQLYSYFEQVTTLIAKEMNIQNTEWLSSGELLIEIKNTNSKLYAALNEFFLAYKEWYDFSFANGFGRDIKSDETQHYDKLRNKRDTKREQVLSLLRNH